MEFEKIKLALEPITELRKGKLYLLLFIALIYTTGYGILYPFYPTLVTNFFAKRITGIPIDCTNPDLESEYDDACQKAHTQSVFWNTVKSFCALFLGIFINPVFSRWSDFYGRKLFYMFGLVSGIWPPVSVFLYAKFDITFFLYYVAQAINDSYASPVIAFAFASDVINKQYTSIIYGFIIGVYMLGFLLSSIIVATNIVESSLHAAFISSCMVLVSILLVIVVPESTTHEQREKAKMLARETKGNSDCCSRLLFAFKSFRESLRILCRNSEFKIIATVIFLISMLNFQFFDIIFQYLQEVAGFGTQEQSVLSIIKFAGFIIVMFSGSYFFLNILKLSEKQFLLISLLFSAVKQLLLVFCKSAIVAYIAEGIGSFDAAIFPTINSICSKMAKNTEQGSALGAIMSVKSFAQGIGPIVILGIYIVFRLDEFIYFPGAPFVYSFLVVIISIFILMRLNVRRSGEVEGEEPLIGSSE